MDIFNSAPRRKRSHGHRHYTSPIFHDVSLNDLLPFMQKPLGMHHIRSKLFSLTLSKLHALYVQLMFGKPIYKSEFKWIKTYSNRLGYCRSQIVLKPVGIKKDEIDKRSFMKLSFANKGIDAINVSNILHHKSVKSDDDQILSNELWHMSNTLSIHNSNGKRDNSISS